MKMNVDSNRISEQQTQNSDEDVQNMFTITPLPKGTDKFASPKKTNLTSTNYFYKIEPGIFVDSRI